jgi:hypothetical protein
VVRLAALTVLVASVTAARPAAACASCGCGDPTLTAVGLEKPYKNRVRLALEERYGSLSVGDGTYGQRVWFLRSVLGVSWMPMKRLTLSALVPWVTAWLKPVGRARQEMNGLGDAELAARVLLFEERGFSPHHLLWGSAGLKMPTGYRTYDDSGYPFPDDDQPGSGSWDPFVGMSYGYFSGNLISFFISASYRYTTPGWHGYRRGSALGASAGLQVQPWGWGALVLGLDNAWVQADTLPNGVAAPSTGGEVLYVAPSLLLSPRQDLLVRVVVDVPAATALYGSQSVGTQVMLSVAYDAK